MSSFIEFTYMHTCLQSICKVLSGLLIRCYSDSTLLFIRAWLVQSQEVYCCLLLVFFLINSLKMPWVAGQSCPGAGGSITFGIPFSLNGYILLLWSFSKNLMGKIRIIIWLLTSPAGSCRSACITHNRKHSQQRNNKKLVQKGTDHFTDFVCSAINS